MSRNKYFFDNIDDLIGYMKSKYQYISPLKLQKGLYFLFAYYTQLYGNRMQMIEEVSEEDFSVFPEFLFDANFEAWKYGPVIREVYNANKQDDLTDNYDEEVFNSPQGHEIKLYIDEILSELMTTSDFSLVDRSHEDDVWKVAYERGNGQGEMSKGAIAKEYSNEG